MLTMERVVKNGYVVLQEVITPGQMASIMALRADAGNDAGQWRNLFLCANPTGPDGILYDTHRQERNLPREVIEDLEETLRPMWQWFYPTHEASSWVVIRSLPGGSRQAPHLDFRPTLDLAPLDVPRVPAGLIIATQENTRIHTWGWNRHVADMRDEEIIVLHSGDVLIFRGDLIHAGAGYSELNLRVHAYLSSADPNEVQIGQDTYIVPVLQEQLRVGGSEVGRCPLHNCSFQATGNAEKNLKRHMQRFHHLRVSKKTQFYQ
jgi:hypothetical protein